MDAIRSTTHDWQTASLSVGDCELFYRHRPAARPTDRVCFLFHRGHEHSGRLLEIAEALDLDDVHLVAWDARGHGRSPGKRGFAPDGFHHLVRDMDAFVRGICERLDSRPSHCQLLAHSVASAVALAWVHDYEPGIAGLTLVTPALRVRLYVPLALPALRLLNRWAPEASISSYVKGRLLSHDPVASASYDADPLVSKQISNRVLIEMADAARRLVADAGSIRVPLCMVQAGNDWVVDNRVQDDFFRRLGSPHKQRIDCPGFYHAALHERDRGPLLQALRHFIRERWSEEARRSRRDDDRLLVERGSPHSWEAYRALTRPLSVCNPQRWGFALARLGLGVTGRLSKGMAIGLRHGFDSGPQLDHVYRNRAEGLPGIGKLTDRQFLDAIGWRGIRQRKRHMQSALDHCVEEAAADRLQIVDLASGPGRYLLDYLREQDAEARLRAECRDWDETGLEEGRELARQLGLEDRVVHRRADAFSAEDIAGIDPRPDIVIVCGLYELFPDNALLRRSLAAIAAVLPPGGRLIYTTQTWHPQLAVIARVLRNRDGEAWVMRCRSQAEMDALVADAGLDKERTWADRWGIFTVSAARKPDA